jgi:hypothetical protein
MPSVSFRRLNGDTQPATNPDGCSGTSSWSPPARVKPGLFPERSPRRSSANAASGRFSASPPQADTGGPTILHLSHSTAYVISPLHGLTFSVRGAPSSDVFSTRVCVECVAPLWDVVETAAPRRQPGVFLHVSVGWESVVRWRSARRGACDVGGGALAGTRESPLAQGRGAQRPDVPSQERRPDGAVKQRLASPDHCRSPRPTKRRGAA